MLLPKLRSICWPPCVALSVYVSSLSLPSLASFHPPSNIGKPGNREGAATRVASGPALIPESTSAQACTQDPKAKLTALVPEGNNGLTTAAYPTFYWVIPENRAQSARFQLYSGTTVANGQPLYETTLVVNPAGGLTSFSLPTTGAVPPLTVGQDYRWEVTYRCATTEFRTVNWIRRVNPSPNLAQQLVQAQGRSRYQLYAEAGFWYDALATLVALRQAKPQEATLAQDWAELFDSASVKLNQIARASLFPMISGQKATGI